MKTNSVGVFKVLPDDYEILVKQNIGYFFCFSCEVCFSASLFVFLIPAVFLLANESFCSVNLIKNTL